MYGLRLFIGITQNSKKKKKMVNCFIYFIKTVYLIDFEFSSYRSTYYVTTFLKPGKQRMIIIEKKCMDFNLKMYLLFYHKIINIFN